jgi:hypothetical protein
MKRKNKITILKTSDSIVKQPYTRIKRIDGANGGIVSVGDPYRGISDVTVLPDSEFEEIAVTFKWKFQGLLIGKVELSCHEILKKDPVRLRLSYFEAKLERIDESQVCIYEFNDMKNLWEPIKSRVDRVRKQVVGYIKHSSYYALGVKN